MKKFYPVTKLFPQIFVCIIILALVSLFVWRKNILLYAASYPFLTAIVLANVMNADTAMSIGDHFFNGGAYDLALAERGYKRALELDSLVPLAHYQIARIRFISGNLYGALQEIDKEIELHPAYLRSLYVRGLIGGYAGQLTLAEKDFARFIDWSPQEWAGYNDLVWIQLRLEKFKEAKKTILLAFERIPGEKDRNLWLWTNLGVVYLNLREYNKAKDALLVGLRISEKIDAKWFWSAYPGNDPRNAEGAFKQFLATLHFNLGVVYEKLNDKEMAQIEYKKYLTLFPGMSFSQKMEMERKLSEFSK